jgi:hypothetical protein
MPFESPPEQPQTPSAPRTRRLGRLPRAVMVGGLAVGLALGGAGIAFAATSGSTTPSTTTPSKSGPRAPGPFRRGFPGPAAGPFGFGGFGGLGRVVHGEFTTRTPSGGYQLVEVQTGKVTAKPATPITVTVTSADGYQHTYQVTSSTVVDAQRDGISSVATGDQVEVTATPVNGKDTATNIVDTTKVGASRKGFGFGPRPGTAPAAPDAPATQSAD